MGFIDLTGFIFSTLDYLGNTMVSLLGLPKDIIDFIFSPVSLGTIPVLGPDMQQVVLEAGNSMCGFAKTVPYMYTLTSVFAVIVVFEIFVGIMRLFLGSRTPELK